MFRARLRLLALITGGLAVAFVLAQLAIVKRSVEFDLSAIGRSLYEARTKNGIWPRQLADLEGTEYLRMPHRKAMLEDARYVIVRHDQLDPTPEANRDRILAYDNTTVLSRFGRVWVCRRNLRIEKVDRAAVERLPRLE